MLAHPPQHEQRNFPKSERDHEQRYGAERRRTQVDMAVRALDPRKAGGCPKRTCWNRLAALRAGHRVMPPQGVGYLNRARRPFPHLFDAPNLSQVAAKETQAPFFPPRASHVER